jgi:magnesium transporter
MSSNPAVPSNEGTRPGLPTSSQSAVVPESGTSAPGKKRKHRSGKKKRNRRQSFIATTAGPAISGLDTMLEATRDDPGSPESPRTPFFSRGPTRRLSESSLESEALLDHR